MRTKIQAIKQKHEDSIIDLQKILGLSHSQDDFSGFIKGIGGEVEKFLKEGVYNNTLNNRDFYQLIDELSAGTRLSQPPSRSFRSATG